MIEIDALFTMRSVREMSKGKRIANFVIYPLLSAVLLAAGLASLIRGEGTFERLGAVLFLVLCPGVLVLMFFMNGNEVKGNQKSFGVDKGDVKMNYKFSESAVLITRTAEGRTDRETLHYRELYKVKRTKKYFLLYVNKDEMYYVPALSENFVSGDADGLFRLFYENKVILDY